MEPVLLGGRHSRDDDCLLHAKWFCIAEKLLQTRLEISLVRDSAVSLVHGDTCDVCETSVVVTSLLVRQGYYSHDICPAFVTGLKPVAISVWL